MLIYVYGQQQRVTTTVLYIVDYFIGGARGISAVPSTDERVRAFNSPFNFLPKNQGGEKGGSILPLFGNLTIPLWKALFICFYF